MPKNNAAADTTQTTILFSSPDQEPLNISTLETWLWDAAGKNSVSYASEEKNFWDGSELFRDL